ncbi:TIGR00730 family Rossman fold protein [Laceyella tengchongensis]|uniref:TIGR00730 family Rossman fold protein n=1 Tax=Laceyella tengchongensis TaxID=574699 RepID=UPI0012B79397|nr:TIGR00730 family Rossman fold protein [Laceyella tengchongensis]
MERICVYAGSNPGNKPLYSEAARELGKCLAMRGIELVYGGSRLGLMGAVAEAALAGSGRVIGVMPTALFRGEMVHQSLTQLIEVADMHERKAKMMELSDGFIALPGGYGTLEEVFEVLSWGQLGIHKKPIGLLNVDGYYEPVLDMIQKAVSEGFFPKDHGQIVICESEPARLLALMEQYQPPALQTKWTELAERK